MISENKRLLEKQVGREISYRVAIADYNEQYNMFNEVRLVDKSFIEGLSEVAIYDSLTGLYKRGVFDSLLLKEIKKHRRHQKPLSLLMLDIDDFKKINDNFGHQEGDIVLMEIGEVILEQSRIYDIECRYGGE